MLNKMNPDKISKANQKVYDKVEYAYNSIRLDENVPRLIFDFASINIWVSEISTIVDHIEMCVKV